MSTHDKPKATLFQIIVVCTVVIVKTLVLSPPPPITKLLADIPVMMGGGGGFDMLGVPLAKTRRTQEQFKIEPWNKRQYTNEHIAFKKGEDD